MKVDSPKTSHSPAETTKRGNKSSSKQHEVTGDTPDLSDVPFTMPSESHKGVMSQKWELSNLSNYFARTVKNAKLVKRIFQ